MREKIKNNRLVLTLLAALAAVFLVQIVASGVLAGKGETVLALEEEIEKLQQENGLLSQEVAEGSSLTEVASRSAELGFGKPESIIYLGEDLPVAHLNAQSSP